MTTRPDSTAAGTALPGERTRRAFIKRVVAAGALASASAARFDGSLSAQQSAGIRSIDHVSIPMENTQAMVAFYRGLGMDVLHDGRRCHLRFGDQKIHFHQPHLWQRETFTLRGPTALPGCGDFCFVWEGAPESLRAALDRAGAEIIEGRRSAWAGGTAVRRSGRVYTCAIRTRISWSSSSIEYRLRPRAAR